MSKHRGIPKVNEVGEELARRGFVASGSQAYNQTNGNGFEIARYLADKFGFVPPMSKMDVNDWDFVARTNILWGNLSEEEAKRMKRSSAHLVLRKANKDGMDENVHLTFEYAGREYNYGPGNREGFPIKMRFPLSIKMQMGERK